MLGPLDLVTCKAAALFHVYMGPLDPCMNFIATCLLHPFQPHVGPLNLVTCKEAAPLFCVYRSISPMMVFDLDHPKR